jgi:hypothetical protein
VRNGVVTEIGQGGTPEPLVPGHSYRVRFESIGEQHVVFLDGLPSAMGRDATLTHGHPGVAGYRTRYEVDNVVVTGGTRVLTVQDSVDTYFQSDYSRVTGKWSSVIISDDEWAQYSHMRQTDTTGDARHFSRTPLANQVVSARLRPLSYGTTTGAQDPWFGVAARVVDDRNFLYLSLRRSNQLSLRKVVNGAVQVIANVPVTVTPNQWYDLRLEVVSGNIRAFVNGDLKVETTDSTLPPTGRSGVLMYKTASDLWAWTTYQP